MRYGEAAAFMSTPVTRLDARRRSGLYVGRALGGVCKFGAQSGRGRVPDARLRRRDRLVSRLPGIRRIGRPADVADKRWVVVGEPGGTGARVVIAQPRASGRSRPSARRRAGGSAISSRRTISRASSPGSAPRASNSSRAPGGRPMESSPYSAIPGAASGTSSSPPTPRPRCPSSASSSSVGGRRSRRSRC